jgi:ClpP class serine protease
LIARIEMAGAIDLEAVAAKLGRPLENTGNRVEMRGQTAVLSVKGPIIRHADLLSNASGLTTVEHLAQDFHAAIENPAVRNILLRVNSPGGQVNGIADTAEMFRNSPKPVTAFIDGLGASAAYWLASAAESVYGSIDSFAGSIGVVATLTDRKAAEEKEGIKRYQIISSQSPRKLMDPSTEDGHASILEMVDSLGDLFVNRVAGYRGVEAAHVLSEYGKGSVKPARLAEKAGMIDGIMTEEGVLASLKPQTTVAGFTAKEDTMDAPITGQQPPAPAPPAPAVNHAAEERQRIQAILALPEAQGRAHLAQTLAFEPGMTAEAAKRILAAAGVDKPPAAESPLDRGMAKLQNPHVGAGNQDENDEDVEVKKILAFIPSHQRVKSA